MLDSNPQGIDLGHPVTFNVHVGDVNQDGQAVDRQFYYYPHAQPSPVLVSDGGMGGQENMEAESLTANGVLINEHSTDQLAAFYWQATKKYREHHDAVARGEIDPADTPDGNPPPSEMQAEPTEPPFHQNGNGFPNGDPRTPGHQEGGFESQAQPLPDNQAQAFPTVDVDIETFIAMQTQLATTRYQAVLDLQDMVIQTQAVLLQDVLDPNSPHHSIIELWMKKLEEMRDALDGRTHEDTGTSE